MDVGDAQPARVVKMHSDARPGRKLAQGADHALDRLGVAPAHRVGDHENGERIDEAATGDGPIDAIFRALVRATGHRGAHLEDYQVRSVTLGEDAQGQVTVVCRRGDRAFRGSGYSTDIVEASAQGVLEVINQWERLEQPIPGSPAMAEAGR